MRLSEGKSAILCSPADAFLPRQLKQFRSTRRTATRPLQSQTSTEWRPARSLCLHEPTLHGTFW